MISFWEALQLYRKQGNTCIRRLSSQDVSAIKRLQGPRAKKQCAFCTGPCPGRKTSWCSDKCVNLYWVVQNESQVVARTIQARDQEVCQRCGLDMRELVRSVYDGACEDFDRAARRLHRFIPQAHQRDSYTIREASQLLSWLATHRIWEIDHIHPVYLGGGCGYGGNYGLDNMRTLCASCHAHVTSQQARQRAKDRKVAKI